jgi:hypothetical protein
MEVSQLEQTPECVFSVSESKEYESLRSAYIYAWLGKVFSQYGTVRVRIPLVRTLSHFFTEFHSHTWLVIIVPPSQPLL